MMLMESENLAEFYKWFNTTVGDLNINEPDIKNSVERKIHHTFRVCKNICAICKSLKLTDNESKIAEAIALLHDVGRFEQYIQYETLVDSVKDHAELGVLALKSRGILNQLSDKERNIILKSIKYHNKYQLPAEEDETVLFYSKLIRDADKMDNYFIHVKYFEKKSDYHKPILKIYPDTGEYSKEVVQAVLSNKCPEDCYIRTYSDLKLTYVGWIFDINFNYAIEYIASNSYINRLLNSLPNAMEIQKIYSHVNKYIEEKLKLCILNS